MSASTSEMLLAMRSPDAGWLAVIACVLDEASRDPGFDAQQRQLTAQLLQHKGPLPEALANAARHRASRFESELADEMGRATDAMCNAQYNAPALQRPKLTLVDNG